MKCNGLNINFLHPFYMEFMLKKILRAGSDITAFLTALN